MAEGNMDTINAATDFVKKKVDAFQPRLGIVLGSGLGNLADTIEEPIKIKYQDIPGFSASSVQGHAGQLVIGKLKGKNVVAMQGRLHYYEGHSFDEVTLPIRLMKKLGVETLIVTNAAGGVDKSFKPGDLMIITDHVNFSSSPLRGKNLDEFGPRFPDLSTVYDKQYMALAKEVAKKEGIDIKEGVYWYSIGPSFETATEVKILGSLGISAVGMSTVPEVVVAAHSSMKVLGISCITNMACGITDEKLSHAEVIETTTRVNKQFIALLQGIIEKI